LVICEWVFVICCWLADLEDGTGMLHVEMPVKKGIDSSYYIIVF
jgi:hypothetical protein